jgi:hypothetical protein
MPEMSYAPISNAVSLGVLLGVCLVVVAALTILR